MTAQHSPDQRRRYSVDGRWIALGMSLLLALLAAVLYLGLQHIWNKDVSGLNLQQALQDPRIRSRVVGQLVDNAAGFWDAHPDPDVGYTLLPGLVREQQEVEISSNSLGLREEEFELPKPPGLTRVVLLGDSYVFATGLPAEDRMGVILEEYLRAGAEGFSGELEVLHLGVASWNIVAECAYLRRQLSLLQPDLVIQITVPNDLDDVYGVRGFGGYATFSGQHRERADALVQYRHPEKELGLSGINHLPHAFEHESRSRFEEAATAVERLSNEVERQGGKYLILIRWPNRLEVARRHLVPGLQSHQVGYLSTTFAADERTWVSPANKHWNRRGMQRVAQIIYAFAVEHELLPALRLRAEPAATKSKARICGRGAEESLVSQEERLLIAGPLDASVNLQPVTQEDAAHVIGGVDREGYVSPYASITLRNPGGTALRLSGSALPRPEMDGARVSVYVDEFLVGELELHAEQVIDESWPLPDGVSQRSIVAVRLIADDYVYIDPLLRHCAVFRMERLAID